MLQSAYQVPGRDSFDYQQDNGGCFLIIDPLPAQALVSVKNPEKFVRFEFLLRLADDEGHDLQASRIVSAAERYGMMRDIDQWVIDQAFSMIAELGKDDRRGKLIYAINLSLCQCRCTVAGHTRYGCADCAG